MSLSLMVEHPQLVPFARYRWDAVRNQHQLVFPEGLLKLNETGAAIVQRCDGRPVDELIDSLCAEFGDCCQDDVRCFLQSLNERGLLRDASNS